MPRYRVTENAPARVVDLLPQPNQIGGYPLDRVLINSRELAAALRITKRTLTYWTAKRRGKRPRLSYVKIGKTKRFVVADVLRFLDGLKVRGAEGESDQLAA